MTKPSSALGMHDIYRTDKLSTDVVENEVFLLLW